MARRHNTAARPGAKAVYAQLPETTAQSTQGAPLLDEHGLPIPPADWQKGEFLNVRNAGDFYNVTKLGEEYDPRQPERGLQFTNVGDCQNFVSRWYSTEYTGPRPF